MRVLFIITQSEAGGAQKNVHDLRNGLLKREDIGVEVLVAVGNVGAKKDKIWLQHDYELKNLVREIDLVRDWAAIWEIRDLINKVRPDVVHLHSSKAGLLGAVACFLAGVPCVYTVHGFVFLEPMNPLKKFLYISIEIFSSYLRQYTILITKNDISVGKSLGILRRSYGKKYQMIPNGLDESQKSNFLPRSAAREYIFSKIHEVSGVEVADQGQEIVGTIANLYKTKGLEYFIEAASMVGSNCIFVVMGFGEDNYKLELLSLIKERNVSNRFFLLGAIPSAYKYLLGLDIFVLSSVKEGLPYCLLEAKLADLPIVATQVGGVNDLAKEFEISLVESKNPISIAKGITNALHKEKVITGFPEIYTLKNMLEKTFQVYKRFAIIKKDENKQRHFK